MTNRDKTLRGLTLIENLIAISILTIAVFSLITLLMAYTHHWQNKKLLLNAQELLHKQVSILMNVPWDQLSSGSKTQGIYTLSWTVTKTSDGSLARIKVSVQWRDPKGELRQLDTYVERYAFLVPPSAQPLVNSNPYGTALQPER